MTVNSTILLTIMLCGIVTWLPRVIPFALSKKVNFPSLVNKFLSYIPMCILTALFIQSLLIQQKNGLPLMNGENTLASIPTLLVAIITKDLMWTVIVGIVTMAGLRFFM